jgi:hypothetical protein
LACNFLVADSKLQVNKLFYIPVYFQHSHVHTAAIASRRALRNAAPCNKPTKGTPQLLQTAVKRDEIKQQGAGRCKTDTGL